MSFRIQSAENIYLLSTEVENMFINEYLPDAPGDYVKIYIYALFCAAINQDISDEGIALKLGLAAETVKEAWDYWEKLGVIRRLSENNHNFATSDTLNRDIEFVNLRCGLYGGASQEGRIKSVSDPGSHGEQEERGLDAAEEKQRSLRSGEFRELCDDIEDMAGISLSPRDVGIISSWVTEIGASYELIRGAYGYCAERGKTSPSYIEKVVIQWHAKGLATAEDVEKHIEKIGVRQGTYRQILNSLGLNRNATKAERELMDKWLDEMHFELRKILEACDTTIATSQPNLKYVNAVLENWALKAKADGQDVNSRINVPQSVLEAYYGYLREKAEKAAQARKLEIYGILPEIEETDRELQGLQAEVIKEMIKRVPPEETAAKRKRISELAERRDEILRENNISVDYTDVKYSCEKCRDTGFDQNGARCSCTEQRKGEAGLWQKSNRRENG